MSCAVSTTIDRVPVVVCWNGQQLLGFPINYKRDYQHTAASENSVDID